MLEGLAVWALFIYLLRLIGMPWNKFSKGFAYIGGVGWLMFVWVGLINYTPMDLSGGSLVQAPHIQLRPDSSNVTGKVIKLHIKPNQQIKKGQLIYEIDPKPYQIALDQAVIQHDAAQVALDSAIQDVEISKSSYLSAQKSVETTASQLRSAQVDYTLQRKMLKRFQEQNAVVSNTITESDIDKQISIVEVAKHKVKTTEAQLDKRRVDANKALLSISKYEFAVDSRRNDLRNATESVERAQWDLDSTKVYAPTDGFVTNFILREGQLLSRVPRLQMYTNEKYVLMRVNHQAIRNIKAGQPAEFSTSVYPGHVFAAEVEGIVEATGESQGTLLAIDQSVRTTTGKNLNNKHHFVRLKIQETEGYDIPVGAVGLAWVSGEKPIGFLAFLDVIRGIILRMKSQLYFFYSI
ncbi:biotin/lipoyl-binding protein [Vibrio mediterranei]|uniref:HlyD family secretion protein n=1 Tax=Vibrio mediterranei TaxID=689 RepID=UPI00148D0762|nr:biotin/lipoyl-binding protein [Vibrio mediterranei]MCG9626868.1 biotin/lipoyl-binding protein [Vibrio mediterranei]NOI25842.1 HlyD family secretion protein [Vibrio mediterranei]